MTRDRATESPIESADWITEVREQTRHALREYIGDRPVVLLDIPTHMNVGDSLIWQGEREFLKSLGTQVLTEADYDSWDPSLLQQVPPETVVLLHGGGNFGDLWPRFHNFRLEVITAAQRHRVIQLPQSIHFENEAAVDRTRSVLASHPDLILLLREDQSLRKAAALFPDVRTEFMPDMALGIKVNPAYDSSGGRVALLRGDHERAFDLAPLARTLGAEVRDWGDTASRPQSWRLSRIPRRLQRGIAEVSPRTGNLLSPWVQASYRRMRRMNLDNGIRALEGTSLVITDRLHAHILAGLMGIPCIVFDNNYGKISSVFDATTGQFADAHLARDAEHAEALAAELLGAK